MDLSLASCLSEVIRSLPKVEIHIHAEGTTRFSTYDALNKLYQVDGNLCRLSDYRRFLRIGDLSEMLRSFLHLQSFFRRPQDYALSIRDLASYAKLNNIVYMEAHVSLSIPRKNGLPVGEILDVLDRELDSLKRTSQTDIRLIVDVSRSFGVENAVTCYELIKSYCLTRRGDTRVIGVGLGGKEQGNAALPYKDLFRVARSDGFHTVAHAGEETGPESIWEALHDLDAERIGHGTSAFQDPLLMEHLKKHAVPLEVCPTSNCTTGHFTKQLKTHPVSLFHRRGLAVTINTDDPVLFDVDLNTELEKLVSLLGFRLEDLLTFLRNGITATFLSEEEKRHLHTSLTASAERVTQRLLEEKVLSLQNPPDLSH